MKSAYLTAAVISWAFASSASAHSQHSHRHLAPAAVVTASTVPTPTPAPGGPNAGMPAGGMNHDTMGQGAGGAMNCSMMADSGSTKNDMSALMTDMRAMMNSTSDLAMKARMQRMHEQMAGLMAKMQKMSGGMSGMGGMTGGTMMLGRPNSGSAPTVAPSTAPKDHAAHHPK